MDDSKKIYSIDEIKDLIYGIFKKYNIDKAYIFGSYARGEATNNSDIDIMIKKGNAYMTLVTLGALFTEIEKILKKKVDIIIEETYTKDIKYDDKSKKLAKKIFYNEVLLDRVKIYG